MNHGVEKDYQESIQVNVDEARLADSWQKIEHRLEPKRPKYLVPAGLGLAAAAAAVLLTVARSTPPEPIAPIKPRIVAQLEQPLLSQADTQEHRLVDGSSIKLQPHSRVEVLSQSPRLVNLSLRKGRALFRVNPESERRWLIQVAQNQVEVTGTIFEVRRLSHRMEVRVDEGSVLVRGPNIPDGVQKLQKGDSLGVELKKLDSEKPPKSPDKTAALSEKETKRSRRRLAPRQKSEPLPKAVETKQMAEETKPALPSVAELMDGADEARGEANYGRALALLAKARNYPEDFQAAVAVLTRGRLAQRLGKYREAAGDIEWSLSHNLPQALRETALVRLAKVYRSADDPAAAARVARKYLQNYPRGNYQEAMKELAE